MNALGISKMGDEMPEDIIRVALADYAQLTGDCKLARDAQAALDELLDEIAGMIPIEQA